MKLVLPGIYLCRCSQLGSVLMVCCWFWSRQNTPHYRVFTAASLDGILGAMFHLSSLSDLLGGKRNYWVQCTDPVQAWREGWRWTLRVRTILGVSVLDALGFVGCLYVQLGMKLSVIAAIPGVIVVCILWTLRQIVVHTTEAGTALHRLTHFLRDDVAGILESANSPEENRQALYRERYNHFHNSAADHIAEVFRRLTGDTTVNCAIRLAQRTNGYSEYITVGRSQNMHPSRRDISFPIPSDKGIAHFLREKKRQGVFVVNDIQQASTDTVWLATPTDKLPDVKHLLIAAINGYNLVARDSREKTMVGILYVTSSERAFGQRHVDLVMSFADLLGLAYPIITGAAT
jgi:hypothetical protein